MTLKNVLGLSAAVIALTLVGCGDIGKKKEGEEHKTEEAAPATEEHKTDAPAAEEHKTDAPAAEEHKTEEAKPEAEVAPEEHKAEAPAAEEHKAEEEKK